MRFVITGNKGLIARNLTLVLKSLGHVVVSDPVLFDGNFVGLDTTGEACVYRNSEQHWTSAFKKNEVDVVIHNAAVVGTDVVALNPQEAVLSNIQGTHNIVRAANAARCGVCYLGTTVIYDTRLYQDAEIEEDSIKNPRTYYGIQKLAAEDIVKNMTDKWCIVRPLFAYGGLGDMNSLIAKTIYASLTDRADGSLDMFLDPDKTKDYLHVLDFCRAIEGVCSNAVGWGTDWNVAAETGISAGEVVGLVDEVLRQNGLKPGAALIKWYPRTDYLGNHLLSARKIRDQVGWKPRLSLREGICDTLQWIGDNLGTYDPLIHLTRAKISGIDLTTHFPR